MARLMAVAEHHGARVQAPLGTGPTSHGRFQGPVDIRVYQGPKRGGVFGFLFSRTRAVLLAPLVYEPPADLVNPDDREGVWRVPQGFDFDGASIPRGPARWYAGDPLDADNLPAAALHDWARRSFRETGKPSLAKGDRLFHRALLALGKRTDKARVMHFAVRATARFR